MRALHHLTARHHNSAGGFLVYNPEVRIDHDYELLR